MQEFVVVWHGFCMETLLLKGHYKCASLSSHVLMPPAFIACSMKSGGESYGFTCDVVACRGHSSNSNNIILLLITAVLLLLFVSHHVVKYEENNSSFF